MYVMSEKSVSRRLLLFSVHNIVGLCQHVPFQDFARYNPTVWRMAFSLRWTPFYGQPLMACLSFLSISFFMPFLACRYINTSSAAISKIISAADGHPTCS